MTPRHSANATEFFLRPGMILDDGTNVRLVIEEVSGGGLGVVAIGHDERNGNRRLVLKTFNPYNRSDGNRLLASEQRMEWRQAFIRGEAEIWCGLWPQPTILAATSLVLIDVPSALDGTRFPRHPFVVLDYAKGIDLPDGTHVTSLGDLFRAGYRPSIEQALRWAQDLAAALAYLHEPDNGSMGMARDRPVVHRDLKPDNLFFYRGHLVVSDLGLARFADDQAPNTGQNASASLTGDRGTPGYAAPEQLRPDLMRSWGPTLGPVDSRADLFSFGAILYELLTGQRAFRTQEAVYFQSAPDLRAILPKVPDAVAAIYAICTYKEARERTLTARQIYDQLRTTLGDQTDPLSELENSKRDPSECARVWGNWAMVFSEIGDPAGALWRYDQAIALDATDAVYWNGRGNALSDLQRPTEALAAYDQAIALDATNAGFWLGRGNALSALQRPTEALAAYDQAIALDAGYTFAWNGRGNALSDLGRHAEALAAFDQAIALDATDAVFWNGRGNALSALQRPTEALAAFDQAIALDASYWEAAANRAILLTDLKRYDEATNDFARAVAIVPDEQRLWFPYGFTLALVGRNADALLYVNRVLAQDPENQPALALVLAIYQTEDQLEAALAVLDRLLALLPDQADLWFTRGDLLQQVQRSPEAVAAYEQGLILAPTHLEGIQKLTNILDDLQRYDEAEPFYRQLTELEPSEAMHWRNLAGNYTDQRRFEAALAAAERAIAIDPVQPRGHKRRGQALNGMERYAEALAELEGFPVPDDEDYWEALAAAYAGLGRADDAAAVRAAHPAS